MNAVWHCIFVMQFFFKCAEEVFYLWRERIT